MFKIGDVVRCIRDSTANTSFNLPSNKYYRITHIGYSRITGEIKTIKLEGRILEYSASRFENVVNFKSLKII